jgi:ankyrin repeat protein
MLVDMGAEYDKPNLQLITPLHAAVERGELDLCKYLVDELGADVFTTNTTDMTCMHTASKFGRLETFHWLMEKGLDMDATDQYGATPLDVAKSFGHGEMAAFLMGKGAATGMDYLRDPKSRAKSVYMKLMLGRGGDDGDGEGGAVTGLIAEGEIF